MKPVKKVKAPPPVVITDKEKNKIEKMFVWSEKLNRAVRVYGKDEK